MRPGDRRRVLRCLDPSCRQGPGGVSFIGGHDVDAQPEVWDAARAHVLATRHPMRVVEFVVLGEPVDWEPGSPRRGIMPTRTTADYVLSRPWWWRLLGRTGLRRSEQQGPV